MALTKQLLQPENQEFQPQDKVENEIPQIPAGLETSADSLESAESIRVSEVKPAEEKNVEPAPASATTVTSAFSQAPKDKDLVNIENILSENLAEAFMQLSPEKQQEFKEEGEKVANTIWQMVESAKIQVRKVITLIKDWLKKLPGLNKFFLEQETKLKTDKIIALARLHRGQAKQHGRER